MIPPIKPEPPLTASIPPIRPGVRPGRSAMEKAIKPASTGTHQREGRAAADLHQRRRQGVFHFKRFDPEGKGERNTQAPATTIGSM